MAKRFVVIGLGRFGTALAESLSERGVEVTAVDLHMENVDKVKDHVAYAVQLDATDPEALRSVECSRASGVAVAIGENFEAAVLTVAALKEIGVSTIIARARTPREGRILAAVGATQVLELETEMGRRLGLTLADRIQVPTHQASKII